MWLSSEQEETSLTASPPPDISALTDCHTVTTRALPLPDPLSLSLIVDMIG